jgi:hypothetical protein
MLIESLAGLIPVRRRMIAFRFGGAMGEPLFGSIAPGLAACGPLSGDPQIDDFSHARAQQLPNAPTVKSELASPFLINYAGTVTRDVLAITVMSDCSESGDLGKTRLGDSSRAWASNSMCRRQDKVRADRLHRRRRGYIGP